MDDLIEFDHKILLFLNDWGPDIIDKIMLFFSNIPVWIPLYVIIAALMFVPKWYGSRSFVHRTEVTRIPAWLVGIIGLAAIGVCFGLTDQISNLIKGLVCRPRPGHEPVLEGMVSLLEGKGGAYGFISGHATNSFGLAVLSSLIFRRWGYSAFILIWATLVSYSRIYVAKHYFGDVICGAVTGAVIALIIYFIWKVVLRKTAAKRQ